ncbi:MAG TPA: AsmA family protein [Terriglobales bacterium]|nr:AsmA family protein [Terriglobales bacterium]
MRRKLLWALGIVVGVILLAVLLLPLLFDANRFRPDIEAGLSQSLARQVKIGDLKLSIFSGGVKADQISIADDPAFGNKPFIQAKSLAVGVQLVPLVFQKQLIIESVQLDEPLVRLLQSANGKWNFSTLGSKKETTPTSANRDFQARRIDITNGRIELGTAGKQQAYTDVQVSIRDLSYTTAFPFTVSAKAAGQGKLSLDGKAGPIDRTDMSRTPFNGKVNVSNLDLTATGMMGSDSGLAGILDYNGTISSDGRRVISEGTAKATKLRLVKAGSAAAQPVEIDYHSEYDLVREQGTIERTKIRTGKSVAQLAGSYASRGASTDVDLKFTGNSLGVEDIKGLLPAVGVILPTGSTLQGGTIAANFNLRGPLEQLVTTGTVNIANTKLTGFSLNKNLSSVATLAGLPATGDTTIQTFSSNLRISPDGTRSDNLNLVAPELGTITGNGTISANGALDFHLVAKLAGSGGVVGSLTQMAGIKGGLKTIPVAVKGTTAKPVFVPDVGSALAGSSGTGTQQQPANPVGGLLQGIFGKKKQQ